MLASIIGILVLEDKAVPISAVTLWTILTDLVSPIVTGPGGFWLFKCCQAVEELSTVEFPIRVFHAVIEYDPRLVVLYLLYLV